ncbi:HlyD family efflux transporter periplasmic adaptor subunit, partial [bacterium]|nr:HlyD family efflux transporter periplasmic adaptor subunit [bacterium]
MKKLFLLLVVVACVAAFFLFKSASDDPDLKKKESQNSTVSLERGLLRVVVETTGQVVPNQEIEIKCKASGEVVKLPVDISDSVSTGDLLVQLDPEKEQRQLEQTEVNLTISKARLQKAQLELEIAIAGLKNETTRTSSALDSTKIKVQEAKARLQRTRDLNARKLTTPEELERAQSASAQAQSDLVGASVRVDDLKTREFQIRSRQEDVKIAEAQVLSNELSLSDAKERLTDTRVLSPIDGVVAERLVQVGQIIASGINNVGGGTKVLSLVDLSRMFIHASVDESDIGRVKTDQRARISVDAYPGQKFRGTVRRVATKGEIVSNVVTFEVRIEVEGRGKSLLKPEMTANLEIIALEREDV